jgi:hypothetical protein
MNTSIQVGGTAYPLGELTIEKAIALAQLWESVGSSFNPEEPPKITAGLLGSAVHAISMCTGAPTSALMQLPLHELVAGLRQLIVCAGDWQDYLADVLTPEILAFGNAFTALQEEMKGE